MRIRIPTHPAAGRGSPIRGSLLLMADTVARQLSTFVTLVVVARCQGTHAAGVVGVAVSLSLLGFGLSALGLDAVLVREYILRRERNRTDLVSVGLAKAAVGAAVLAAIGGYAGFGSGLPRADAAAVMVIALGYLLLNLDVGELYLQSVQAFPALVAPRLATAAVLLPVKIQLARGPGLLMLAAAMAVEFALLQLLLLPRVVQRLRSTARPAGRRLVDLRRVLGLLRQTWKVQLASMLAAVNQRADVLLVAWLVSVSAAGLYSAVGRLAEGLVVVASVVSVAFFPRLVGESADPDRYGRLVVRLVRGLSLIALVAVGTTGLLASRIMTLLFGADFAAAAPALAVYVGGAFFLFVRAVLSKILVVEAAYGLSLLTNCCGAVVNVGLNLVLIPRFGITGAAFATVGSYATSSILALLLTARGRCVAGLLAGGLLPGPRGYRLATAAAGRLRDTRPVLA